MDELILMLERLIANIQEQINTLNEFIPVLDQEELAIASYQFLTVEKSIIAKDQLTRFSQSLEENRIHLLKKISIMMAFDYRNQNLSLPVFKTAFSVYLDKVKYIIEKEIYSKVQELYVKFSNIGDEFFIVFQNVSKRIYRNQLILKKIIKHVSLSLNLFQSETEASMNYDALGKAQSVFNQQSSLSSIRVTV